MRILQPLKNIQGPGDPSHQRKCRYIGQDLRSAHLPQGNLKLNDSFPQTRELQKLCKCRNVLILGGIFSMPRASNLAA